MKTLNFSLSFIFFIIGSSIGYLIVKNTVFQTPWTAFLATIFICYVFGSIGWLIGRKIDPPNKIKIIPINRKYFLLIPIFLIILLFLYQIIRYEKDSFGLLDLKYDRFQGKVYILNSRDPKAQWQITGAKDMRTLKYYLERREKEEAAEQAVKQETRDLKENMDTLLLQQRQAEINRDMEDMIQRQEIKRQIEESNLLHQR